MRYQPNGLIPEYYPRDNSMWRCSDSIEITVLLHKIKKKKGPKRVTAIVPEQTGKRGMKG